MTTTTTTTETLTVANAILAQLGGGVFRSMTGAKDFMGGASSLQFSLPRFAGLKVNKVRIVLDADDTYTVTFYRIGRRGLSVEVLSERTMVYADQLRAVFASATGLALSL